MPEQETQFSVIYGGEALEDGTIDAKDLAPALLAFAELIDETAPLTDGSASHYSLRVRADFERGSFEIHLEIAKLYERFVSLFTGPDATAWSAFFQILGISGAFGIFQLLKRAKGRKPTTVTIETSQTVKLTFDGEDPVSVERAVFSLFNNPRARKAIEAIIKPLFGRGIDLFKLRHKGRDTVEVTEAEAPYFIAPTEHEGKTIAEVDTRLVLLAPSFKPGNKWRVSDGGRSIFVAIEDTGFEQAVQAGNESFRKGDILHVRLQTRQWLDGTELKAEHAIVRVHRHESGLEQGRLL